MKEKVSVIIPIYNVAEFLEECLESICNQTYKNLEIILVDDGSTDSSAFICDIWSKKDERIKVIHKNNGGLSSARNAGLDISSGKYIYFLDGDDTVNIHLIEHVVSYMRQGYDMVAFCYANYYQNKSKEAIVNGEFGKFVFSTDKQREDFILSILLQYKIGWEAWSRMYLREKIERYHLRFADNQQIFAEDLYFCLCYSSHCKRIMRNTEVLYNYRKRDNSIMGTEVYKINIGRMNQLCKEVLLHFKKYQECSGLEKIFPVIHCLIINNIIDRAIKNCGGDWKKIKLLADRDIRDKDFFDYQVKQLKKHKKRLYGIYEGDYPVYMAEERISIMKFLSNGNYTLFRIRNNWIYRMRVIYEKKNPKNKNLKEEYKSFDRNSKGKKKVFLIGTEDFGNLGDHQIAISIIEFVEKYCGQCTIKEVTHKEYWRQKSFLCRYIKENDLILMTGGGNFGDVYLAAQKLREDVVHNWPNNKKIIFPQTIYYTNTENGEKIKMNSKKIFVKQNNIVLFVRDRKSFEFAKKNFSCKSYLAPDIVLSRNLQSETKRENYVLLCFRNDIEKKITDPKISEIKKYLNNFIEEIKETDLQLKYHITKEQRDDEIVKVLTMWRKSKLVITDRLHGMIFAAVTGTPCIVFGNYNHKVREAYEWIEYLPYIIYVENIEEVKSSMSMLLKNKEYIFDNEKIWPYFKKIRDEIQEV